ncbi:STAS domain-containing protein [Sutcliffiella horikoshii]|uniref:STAS domain-containing protein n=1 Tax=Sutcliffiella horikoshii TaxID=79883 RepID=A0A5D4SPC9_9BACI|nr:STAS domain-containing protein [Sutcliffiella horikoshii]TYS64581.1 STAS domain-containing protein [Sutcliffiella horikoshii]
MTKTSHYLIGQKLIDSQNEVAASMLLEIQNAYPNVPHYREESIEFQIKEIFGILVVFLGEYVQDPENKVLDRAKEWGESVGFISVKSGGSLEETLSNMTLYKKCLWAFIQREGLQDGLNMNQITDIFILIDEIFNIIVYGFSHAFSIATEQKLIETKASYIRLSIPIVPLQKGLGVLPLVGEIDEVRAGILIEETLEKSKNLAISNLIIDFSGVYRLDETVLHTMDLLIRSLKLIGITPIITGLRPELSLQFITSGLNLKDIQICGSIAQILQEQ